MFENNQIFFRVKSLKKVEFLRIKSLKIVEFLNVKCLKRFDSLSAIFKPQVRKKVCSISSCNDAQHLPYQAFGCLTRHKNIYNSSSTNNCKFMWCWKPPKALPCKYSAGYAALSQVPTYVWTASLHKPPVKAAHNLLASVPATPNKLWHTQRDVRTAPRSFEVLESPPP